MIWTNWINITSLESREETRTRPLLFLGIAIVVLSFLIPFQSFLPAWIQEDDSYAIRPKERRCLSIRSMRWSFIRGMLAIEEGNISFSLEDSNGNVIIAEQEVSGEYPFEFQASSSDSYMLFFVNGDGSVEKRVDWTVQMYFYNILSFLFGILVFVIGGLNMLRGRIISAKAARKGYLGDFDMNLEPVNVKLVKRDGSIRMTVPEKIADYLGLEEEETVTVYVSNRNMIVKKA